MPCSFQSLFYQQAVIMVFLNLMCPETMPIPYPLQEGSLVRLCLMVVEQIERPTAAVAAEK